MIQFDSTFEAIGRLPEFDESVVKVEPMFFNSDVSFCYRFGGPITKAFLRALPSGWENGIFDSRVHMLMKGWYPCIPGWHHDDVPRSASNGQPNYFNPEYRSEHIMATVNGDICPTKILNETIWVNDIREGDLVYKTWDKEIRERHSFRAENAKSNELYLFDWQSFHCGQKALKTGWRWFGRISRNTFRKPTNEIRTQVQVYLESVNEGW